MWSWSTWKATRWQCRRRSPTSTQHDLHLRLRRWRRQPRLVERQQLAPRAVSVRLAVDRLAVRLLRHVGNTPSVLRLRIDLDFRRHFRRLERFLELGLRIWLLHVVVGRDTEVHPRFDL